MGAIWRDHARKIVENGVFIANDDSNWDLWEHNGTVYSIPVEGSGCGASVWCETAFIRAYAYLRPFFPYSELLGKC